MNLVKYTFGDLVNEYDNVMANEKIRIYISTFVENFIRTHKCASASASESYDFKTFLVSNNLPDAVFYDDGFWRRLRVIPFDGILTNVEKNELLEKITGWKKMFMTLLIKYHRKYEGTHLIIPNLVCQKTEQYRKECKV